LENEQLSKLSSRLDRWLFEDALPLWWRHGADHTLGGFHELLALDGQPLTQSVRRARVQGRQSYVYALAGSRGWRGPWREAAPHGLDFLIKRYLTDQGQLCTVVSADGAVLDSAMLLYDQAFALLAAAEIAKVMPERTDLKAFAHTLLARILDTRRHPAGGFSEWSKAPFQANPHMHLLEAMLAWRDVEPGTMWDRIADEIVSLALAKFIDPDGGYLLEFFDADWRPAAGHAGHSILPGHQFEWAWLLERWSRLRQDADAHQAAVRLYEAGIRGVDKQRDVAIDELSDTYAVTQAGARLWPQTERAKAALILAETADPKRRAQFLAEAARAAASLWRYLETPVSGLWRDKLNPDGTFVDEPAPASSLYHIACCIACISAALAPTRGTAL
jgi:mannose-1-phosphate guanylyltransferase / mannose-6-phosphate isomerase